MTVLPHLWLGSNSPPTPSSIQKFTTVMLQVEEARIRDGVKYFVNQTSLFSIMVDYHRYFPFLLGAQGYNTHENYASALQMLVTILYWHCVCWNEQVADSHWALLWNTGVKGSPSSYFALETEQPTGCSVPGSSFGDMKVHIDVSSLVLLSWDWAKLQTLPSLPALSTPFCYEAFHGLWGLPGQPVVARGDSCPTAVSCLCIAGKNWGEGKG